MPSRRRLLQILALAFCPTAVFAAGDPEREWRQAHQDLTLCRARAIVPFANTKSEADLIEIACGTCKTEVRRLHETMIATKRWPNATLKSMAEREAHWCPINAKPLAFEARRAAEKARIDPPKPEWGI